MRHVIDQRSSFLIAFLCCAYCVASVASASPITYAVTVDTSSIVGTAGSLDFNFNPGPLVTQAADLQITSFSSDGSVSGGAALSGDIFGALPSTLNFENAVGFNDYFQEFTFGSTLSFNLDFYGPALTSPDGVSTSGSTFAFSLFSDQGGSIPTLTTDTVNGFALTVNVNLDGSTTVANYSPFTGISAASEAVPEPRTCLIVPIVLTILGIVLRAKSRSRANLQTSVS